MANTSSDKSYIRVGKFKVRVPATRVARFRLGLGLTIVGILPVPPGPPAAAAGIMILSIDNPRIRKARRKSLVWVGRRTWAKEKLKG